MNFVHFAAGKNDEGRRLDRIARTILAEENLSGLYKALRSGLIKVNGKKQKGEYRVSAGDDISAADFLVCAENKNLQISESAKKSALRPLDKKLVILRTPNIIFINKPYDMNVQKSSASDTALNVLVQEDFDFQASQKTEKSLAFKTGPLHRLDRQTTGLIAFSQSLRGAQWFSKIIQEHKIVKTYLAIVEGRLEKKEIWTDKISKNDDGKSAFHTVSVNSSEEKSKETLTEAFPLGYGLYKGQSITLVKFIIHTGRTHQIRATSAAHGHPLSGDIAYGAKKINESQQLFLHAYSLELPENSLNIPRKIVCKPGENFVSILKTALIKWPDEL